MKKEIYLDNAATTPVNKEVLKTMEPFSNTIYGNPSSFNDAGRQARKALDQSRRVIAHFLGAQDQEVVFTGSGTEANNLAILGLIKSIQGLVAFNRKNPHIITTRIEHDCFLNSCTVPYSAVMSLNSFSSTSFLGPMICQNSE